MSKIEDNARIAAGDMARADARLGSITTELEFLAAVFRAHGGMSTDAARNLLSDARAAIEAARHALPIDR